MAIAFVQQTTAEAKSVTTLAFPSITVTAGDALFVCVSALTGTALSSVSDNNGGTWTRAAMVADSTTVQIEIWYSLNHAAGATVVTITPAASVSLAANLSEFSGVATSSALDVAGSGSTGTSTSALTNPTGTTAGTADLVIGAAGINGNGTISSGPTITGGGGTSPAGLTTAATSGGSPTSNVECWSAYAAETAAGSYSWQWANSKSEAYAGIIAAFKAATGTTYPESVGLSLASEGITESDAMTMPNGVGLTIVSQSFAVTPAGSIVNVPETFATLSQSLTEADVMTMVESLSLSVVSESLSANAAMVFSLSGNLATVSQTIAVSANLTFSLSASLNTAGQSLTEIDHLMLAAAVALGTTSQTLAVATSGIFNVPETFATIAQSLTEADVMTMVESLSLSVVSESLDGTYVYIPGTSGNDDAIIIWCSRNGY